MSFAAPLLALVLGLPTAAGGDLDNAAALVRWLLSPRIATGSFASPAGESGGRAGAQAQNEGESDDEDDAEPPKPEKAPEPGESVERRGEGLDIRSKDGKRI